MQTKNSSQDEPAIMLNTDTKEKTFHPRLVGEVPEPWSISKIKPEIIVFRRDREKMVIGHDTDEEDAAGSLEKAGFLSTSRIVFIAHGFRRDSETQWLHDMKNAMIAERDQTVAIVGWGRGANVGVLMYPQAAANTLAVGQWLARYAAQIRKHGRDIYIWGVGHSLGAHLMGNAGRACGVFDRVTGLDPAGPGFQNVNQDRRLRHSDAKMVDVIHSDGKRVPHFGTLLPLGTIDFYPNYGWGQPNYDDSPEKPHTVVEFAESEGSQKEDREPDRSYGFTVSHRRAIDYFTWSIYNKGKFWTNLILEDIPSAHKAVHRLMYVSERREMGYYADESYCERRGNSCYYVITNARAPWL